MAVIFPDSIEIDDAGIYIHRPTGRAMRVVARWTSPGGVEFVRLMRPDGSEWAGTVDRFWREWIHRGACKS